MSERQADKPESNVRRPAKTTKRDAARLARIEIARERLAQRTDEEILASKKNASRGSKSSYLDQLLEIWRTSLNERAPEWTGSAQNFSPFEMSEAQVVLLNLQFRLLIQRTDLNSCDAIGEVVASHKNVSGVYFWVMRHGDALYRIYIGKTKSLSARIENYIGQFQPHSPNDFKVRVFCDFMVDTLPGATLLLYFAAVPAQDLTKAENAAVRQYDPLLNRRMTASPKARAALREAFTQYYRSAFCRALLGGAEDP